MHTGKMECMFLKWFKIQNGCINECLGTVLLSVNPIHDAERNLPLLGVIGVCFLNKFECIRWVFNKEIQYFYHDQLSGKPWTK